MAILNPSPAAVLPKTMWLALRARESNGDYLSAAPASLKAPQQGNQHIVAADSALNKLGMETVDQKDVKVLTSDYERFVEWLRYAISDPDMDEAEDLRRAIDWLLRQDPTVVVSRSNFEALDQSRDLVNDTRWNTFRFWAVHLGYAEDPASIAQTGSGIVANPVRALISTVKSWVSEVIPVTEFLARLTESQPLLAVAHQEGDLDPLGKAVSWAILGAHYRRWINLETRADAKNRVFLTDRFTDHPQGFAVTHVQVGGRGDE